MDHTFLSGIDATHRPYRGSELSALIDGFMQDEDGELIARQFKDLDDAYERAQNFNPASLATQKASERVLAEYRKWMSAYLWGKVEGLQKLSDPGVQPDANDVLLFPQHWDTVISYIKKYFLLAAANAKARKRDGRTASLSTITNRRYYMRYWLYQKLERNSRRPPWEFMNETNQTILYAAKHYDLGRRMSTKVYLGRNEILQLVEFDLSSTISVPIAEQNHLAWTLTWIAGIRPSSMGFAPSSPDNYFRWSDIIIRRALDDNGIFRGDFILDCEFKYLKTNKAGGEQWQSHEVTIPSPTQGRNIALSPVHRMLVMLLRRGFLQDYDNFESLMAGRQERIIIKDEALSQPVFLAGTEGGRGLIDGRPCAAAAFTQYLNRRCLQIGYPDGSTMYAWRRQAGTTMAEKEGVDTARQFMHHAPNTATFQNHYDKGLFNLNLFAIAGGEDTSAQITQMQDAASVALYRADIARQSYERKAVIEAWIEDQESVKALHSTQDTKKLKLERKRLRNLAVKAFYAKERELQKAKLTVDELQDRKHELQNPSAIFRYLRTKVAELQANPAALASQDDEDAVEELNENLDNFRDMEDELAEGQGDEDGATDQDMTESPQLEFAAGTDMEETDPQTWLALVKMFMQVLLEDRYEPGDMRKCELCVVDETVDEERKNKQYNFSQLQKHQSSKFHNVYSAWRRRMTIEHDKTGEWKCPYGCGRKFKYFEGLTTHIERWRPDADAPDHEVLKANDGWNNPDFKQDSASDEYRSQKRSQNLEVRGYKNYPAYEEPEFRFVDGDPYQPVTIGGGQDAILLRSQRITAEAAAIQKQDEDDGYIAIPFSQVQSQLKRKAEREPEKATTAKAWRDRFPEINVKVGQGFKPISERLMTNPKGD